MKKALLGSTAISLALGGVPVAQAASISKANVVNDQGTCTVTLDERELDGYEQYREAYPALEDKAFGAKVDRGIYQPIPDGTYTVEEVHPDEKMTSRYAVVIPYETWLRGRLEKLSGQEVSDQLFAEKLEAYKEIGPEIYGYEMAKRKIAWDCSRQTASEVDFPMTQEELAAYNTAAPEPSPKPQPTPEPAPTPDGTDTPESSLSPGAIAGIVIAVLVALLGGAAALLPQLGIKLPF